MWFYKSCCHLQPFYLHFVKPINSDIKSKAISQSMLHVLQHMLFYPSRSFWVSRELRSLRASLGKQKLVISSSRTARAPLSTRAKLSRSKKGSNGPKASRVGPLISPSAWEEPCGTRYIHDHNPCPLIQSLEWSNWMFMAPVYPLNYH